MELIVVNPHSGRVGDGDGIIVKNKGDLDVADDDIVHVPDGDATLLDVGVPAHAQQGFVAADNQTGRKRDGALDVDDPGRVVGNSSNELLGRGNGNLLSAFAAGDRTDWVVLGVAFHIPRGETKVKVANGAEGRGIGQANA